MKIIIKTKNKANSLLQEITMQQAEESIFSKASFKRAKHYAMEEFGFKKVFGKDELKRTGVSEVEIENIAKEALTGVLTIARGSIRDTDESDKAAAAIWIKNFVLQSKSHFIKFYRERQFYAEWDSSITDNHPPYGYNYSSFGFNWAQPMRASIGHLLEKFFQMKTLGTIPQNFRDLNRLNLNQLWTVTELAKEEGQRILHKKQIEKQEKDAEGRNRTFGFNRRI